MIAEVWISLCITLGVRKALFSNEDCVFSFPDHIRQSSKIFFQEESSREIIDCTEWFYEDKLNNYCDAYFVEMKEGVRGVLLIGKDGTKSYYECSRFFSHETHQREYVFSRAPFRFEMLSEANLQYDNEAFRVALEDMVQLSKELDNLFRTSFESAIAALKGRVVEPENYSWLDSDLNNREVLIACIQSDLFGGMGSWFDSPLYLAEKRNMIDRFNLLSFKLKEEIRKAKIYVVNHSYIVT